MRERANARTSEDKVCEAFGFHANIILIPGRRRGESHGTGKDMLVVVVRNSAGQLIGGEGRSTLPSFEGTTVGKEGWGQEGRFVND